MDPITVGALMTAGIPFLTAAIKRVFTKKMVPESAQPGVHTVIPLVLGILSTGLYAYSQTKNVWAAVAAGLGSGGAASSIRDVDKNLTRIVETVYGMVKKS